MVRNILSIGNHKAMNHLLRTVLARRYRLIMAEEIFQGMNILKHKQNIDLVIIDIDQQIKESIDFILHINSSKVYNKPVIVLSSIQNPKTNESEIEAHVYDYFIKPFNPIDLLHSISELTLTASAS